MRNPKTQILTEGAIMVALSTVLSMITVVRFPWGGGITLLSMLPVCLFSVRRGLRAGLGVSAVYSALQLFLGITVSGLLGWGLSPVLLIGCMVLDYLLAFFVLGFSGMFRHKGVPGAIGGITLCILVRMLCHVCSGALIFHSAGLIWGFDIANPWLYSLVYNAAYMLPELALTAAAAFVLLRLKSTQQFFRPQ